VMKLRIHFPFAEIGEGVTYFFLFVFYVDTLLELIPPESFDASTQCSLRDLKLIEASGNQFWRLVSNSCVCVCVV